MVLIHLLLFVFVLVLRVESENCTYVHKAEGGGSIRIYSYSSQSDCEEKKKCETLYLMKPECNFVTFQNTSSYSKIQCSTTAVVHEFINCGDQCVGCEVGNDVGNCKDVNGVFSRVEGCTIPEPPVYTKGSTKIKCYPDKDCKGAETVFKMDLSKDTYVGGGYWFQFKCNFKGVVDWIVKNGTKDASGATIEETHTPDDFAHDGAFWNTNLYQKQRCASRGTVPLPGFSDDLNTRFCTVPCNNYMFIIIWCASAAVLLILLILCVLACCVCCCLVVVCGSIPAGISPLKFWRRNDGISDYFEL